jgi:uncharacterized protein (DUF2062 family)
VRDHPKLHRLGHLLHDAALWSLNRRTVSGGVGLGLFIAFVPVPLQMVVAAVVAVAARVNLPIAVAMVLVTNPLTVPPLYWTAYEVGAVMLQRPPLGLDGIPGLSWFLDAIGQIWQPLLLGLLIIGAGAGAIGYVGVRVLWRIEVARRWARRHGQRLATQNTRRAR